MSNRVEFTVSNALTIDADDADNDEVEDSLEDALVEFDERLEEAVGGDLD